jgi:signal recognition particle subunit SRP54
MFDALSDRLQTALGSLTGRGRVTEEDVDTAMREVRLALLEADVNYKVVKGFVKRVKERAIGTEVIENVNAGQMIVKIVHEELTAILGEGDRTFRYDGSPAVVMMVGLQGSGKTTSAAKLARWIVRQGRQPMLVAADIHRPAAIDQLKTLGATLSIPVYSAPAGTPVVQIATDALAQARQTGRDVVILDTAGRLHVDDELMAELAELQATAEPSEVLYVADALTGQDAVRSADEFHKKIGITGIVLTKLDGDSRGGAALSAAAVTGRPVKFAGLGEKVEAFEPFEPGRMVSRILGMGDVLGLIARAEETVELEKAEELARKIRRSEFSLEDYRDQMRQLKKMGPLDQVLSMMPGMGSLKGVDVDRGEDEMRRSIAIIDSMTPRERAEPSVINGSRRKRIARGSGNSVQDVNRLLRQFAQTRKLMKGLGSGSKAMKRLAARMPQLR